MKTIKPQKISVLHRTFEASGSFNLCVTAMVAAPFDAPESPLHEAALWKMLAAELGKDVAPDACMPKARSEVLVNGRAYPRGGARPACSVRLKMGAVDKTLWVVGDRTWDRSGAATDPVPFAEMPLTWARAFGGPGYGANPTGKGVAPVKGELGETHPLPNVEDPKRLVGSPKDRPVPAGFAAYDLTWPERYAQAGTYDDAWLKNQFPGLPLDFDFAFHNTAPPDQRIDGHFRGGEAFTLENMHPQKPVQEGRLPRLLARVFLNLRGGELREVAMRLDTVQLFPGAERVVLLFRGVTRVAEEDASDVLQLIAACEAPGAPRPVEHYRAVLAERLDKKLGALAALRDGDLMPPGPGAKVALDEIADPDLAAPHESLLRKNLRRRLEHEHAEARARIQARGLDPEELVPALPPEPEPASSTDDLGLVVAEAKEEGAKARAEAEVKRAEAEAQARRKCEEAGLDYDRIVAEQQKKQGGPPTFSAAAVLQKLRDARQVAHDAGIQVPALDAQLADPVLRARLQTAEEGLRDLYRKHAHHMTPALPAEAALTERVRRELIAGRAGGVSFAGRDLTGVDLSGLDLRGVDLRSAFLESARFAGTDLAGADLTGAVLAGADFDGRGPDLGQARRLQPGARRAGRRPSGRGHRHDLRGAHRRGRHGGELPRRAHGPRRPGGGALSRHRLQRGRRDQPQLHEVGSAGPQARRRLLHEVQFHRGRSPRRRPHGRRSRLGRVRLGQGGARGAPARAAGQAARGAGDLVRGGRLHRRRADARQPPGRRARRLRTSPGPSWGGRTSASAICAAPASTGRPGARRASPRPTSRGPTSPTPT